MITEDYVSLETAKLLKEKGFDIECQCCYTPKGYIRNLLTDANNTQIQDFNSLTEFEYEGVGLKGWYGSISAPTLQMAMKWLREKHGIIILVSFFRKDRFSYDILLDGECGDNYILHSGYMFEHFQTYEEAVGAAIKYCLENLI